MLLELANQLPASKIVRKVPKAISVQLALKYLSLLTCENKIIKLVEKFYEAHRFPQCIGAIDGTHNWLKKPISKPIHYINRKDTYSLNVQATTDHKFCFFNIVIKWPGSVHDARVYSNSVLNKKLRDGSIPKCSEIIVSGEPAVPICLLHDPPYPLLPYIMKDFSNGGKNNKEHIFGYRLSSARMTIEYSFVHLKARFACFNRNINLKDLPNVIYACFVLHNFCEIQKKLIHQNDPNNALKNDARLQPQTSGNYTIIINEGNGKAIRNTL